MSYGSEYAVFSPEQVLITEIIFYHVSTLEAELSRLLVPSNFMGTVVFIPRAFACWLSEVLRKPKNRELYVHVKELILGKQTASEFVKVFLPKGDGLTGLREKFIELMLQQSIREVFIIIKGKSSKLFSSDDVKGKVVFQVF